jgi:probable F420-dependent oxidoreductase
MKFGTRVHPYEVFADLSAVVDFAQQAEDLGYDYITLPHHTVVPQMYVDTLSGLWWDPIVMATHLAAHTKTIRFITTVLVLPQYNPIELAKQLASVDAASGGRLGIGIGVGWSPEEFNALGADFATRGKRMEEYIKILRSVWDKDPVSFSGDYYSFDDLVVQPKPAQAGGIPIYVGGGAAISIDRAARLGDGWAPVSCGFEEFVKNLGVIREKLVEYGRKDDNFFIIRHLKMFEIAPWINEHLVRANGSHEESFEGDYVGAAEQARFCEENGVTHMTVLFMTDYKPMMVELENFSSQVIQPMDSGA